MGLTQPVAMFNHKAFVGEAPIPVLSSSS